MANKYISEQDYFDTNFTEEALPPHTFEGCRFVRCHFAEADLSKFRFIDTTFVECDFSNAILDQSQWQDVTLERCKLLGLAFEHCNEFGFAIRCKACRLDHASFYEMSLKRSHFEACQMHGVDFTAADLQGIVLSQCDFTHATFDQTKLSKTNLSGSTNYRISPLSNPVKGLKVDYPGLLGLLEDFGVVVVTP